MACILHNNVANFEVFDYVIYGNPLLYNITDMQEITDCILNIDKIING